MKIKGCHRKNHFLSQTLKNSIEHFKLFFSKSPFEPNLLKQAAHWPNDPPNPNQTSWGNSKIQTRGRYYILARNFVHSNFVWMWNRFKLVQNPIPNLLFQNPSSTQTEPMILCWLCSEPFPDILLLRFFCWIYNFEIFAFGFLFLYKIVKDNLLKKLMMIKNLNSFYI